MRKSRLLLGVCVIAAVLAAAWWYLTSAPEPELLGPLPPPRILLPIMEGDEWGLIDETGEVVLEPRYHRIALIGRERSDDGGLPYIPMVVMGQFGYFYWDRPVGRPAVTPSNRPATQIVLGMRVVTNHRAIPTWPFVAIDEELMITILDADLKPRAYWQGPMPSDFDHERPWKIDFTRLYPALPVDDHYAVVRADEIAMTPLSTDPYHTNLYILPDGYAMAIRRDPTQSDIPEVVPGGGTGADTDESSFYAPDGTLLYTGEGKQYITDRFGAFFVIDHSPLFAPSRIRLVNETGDIVAGPARELVRLNDHVLAVLDYNSPSYLLHLPSGRRVVLGKPSPTTPGASTIDWYPYAHTDRRIGVLRGDRLTFYDLNLKEVAVVELAQPDASGATIKAIPAYSRFLVGGTLIDEDGRQTPVGLPSWIEDEGLVYIADGRTWLLGADMKLTPWGIDVMERTLPGTPARKVLTTHDGTRLCEPYAADMQARNYLPPDVTGYTEAVVVLVPIRGEGTKRVMTIQIGSDQYPTTFQALPAFAWDSDTVEGDAVYYSGKRYSWDQEGGRLPDTFRQLSITVDSPMLYFTYSFDGSLSETFDLTTRQWVTAEVDSSGATAVGTAEPAHDLISPIYPAIHIVHFPDETWGYQRPDGTQLWRSRPPPKD